MYTTNASIFVYVPYWPPYSTYKFISCVVPGPSQWFFHLGKEMLIACTHIGWVRWMFQNLPLPTTQEIRDDSSSVTLCIVMKNDRVLYHQVLSFSSESIRLWSFRQSERTTARDPVQYKRWTYPATGRSIRSITKIDTLMVYDSFQTYSHIGTFPFDLKYFDKTIDNFD